MADYDRAFMDKARTEGRCTCEETDQWGGPIGCSIHHSPVF